MTATGWAVPVPRATRTHAVLVGTASHVTPGQLPAIPQAAGDVTGLAGALTGPLGLFDPSRVRRRVDPLRPPDVLDLFPARGPEPLDVCLFSYAGHGLLARGDRLCLALPGSVDEPGRAARTSLPVDEVFEAMNRTGARYKVAILDCCFSGRAFDAPAAADIHLLTATTRTRKARYGKGTQYTAFTGALLRLLAEGVPDGDEYLDLATLYRRLSVTLPTEAEPSPAPAQRTVGASGDLALARNPAFGTGRSRAGLKARAHWASRLRRAALDRPGRPELLQHGARLLGGVVEDGSRDFGASDPQVLVFRHAHGSLVGDAGDPAAAVRLLEAAVADWEAVAGRADDPALARARASLDHWRRCLPR